MVEKSLALVHTMHSGKTDSASEYGVPEFRFPPFRSQAKWREVKLKSFLRPVIREEPKPSQNYLAVGVRSHGKGTFVKPDQSPSKISMDRLYRVHQGDLIVNITFAWEGAIAIADKDAHRGYVSHRFPTYEIDVDLVNPDLLRHIISQKQFVYKLGLISPGGAGRNRVLSKKDFLELTVLLPSLPEQTAIAECLKALDELIDAETKKLHAQRKHKKGLLRSLFPVDGEASPEIRFPEFEKHGMWSEATVSNIIETITPPRKLQTSEYNTIGEFPIVDQSKNAISGWTNDHETLIHERSPLIVFGDHTCELKLIDVPFAQGADGLKIFRTPSSVSEEFLFFFLQSRKISTGQYRRHFSILKGVSVFFPDADSGEQGKIVDCLIQITKAIDAQDAWVENLLHHKRGVIQRLLPALDEMRQ